MLIDGTPDFHIPHLLSSNSVFFLSVRLGLSLAVLQPFQFLRQAMTDIQLKSY
jgi:hypothetical protein